MRFLFNFVAIHFRLMTQTTEITIIRLFSIPRTLFSLIFLTLFVDIESFSSQFTLLLNFDPLLYNLNAGFPCKQNESNRSICSRGRFIRDLPLKLTLSYFRLSPLVLSLDSHDKQASLDQAFQHIERCYGRGSIFTLGSNGNMSIDCLSTGSLTLDLALGGRGYPKGRIIEIYGPESSGKTTLALHAIAEAQKQKGIGAFVDAEHALDPNYAQLIGVNVDKLLFSQPESGEMALDVVDQLIRCTAVDVIVVDSVAALVPKAELEGK